MGGTNFEGLLFPKRVYWHPIFFIDLTFSHDQLSYVKILSNRYHFCKSSKWLGNVLKRLGFRTIRFNKNGFRNSFDPAVTKCSSVPDDEIGSGRVEHQSRRSGRLFPGRRGLRSQPFAVGKAVGQIPVGRKKIGCSGGGIELVRWSETGNDDNNWFQFVNVP